MGKKKTSTPRSRVKNALRMVWLRSRERAAVIKAQDHTCRHCGKRESKAKGREIKIQVHHLGGIDWDGIVDLIFERMLWPDVTRYEVLCVECHAKEHGNASRMP
jgi:hypothetical protein